MKTLLERAGVVFLMVFFFILGMLSSRAPLAASDHEPDNAQIQILPDCTTPTPTRTPTPVNIGNFVWHDLDDDGRQDAGEPGISGVTVQLWNSSKTQLLDSAVTNASGIYTVTAPLPGNYRIRVLLPNATDAFTAKNQAGGDDQLDSDINGSGVNFGFSDTFNLANNVISTTIHDAGIQIYQTPTPTRTPTPINIGNFVWDDYDQDGRQDAGEPGISGVTVQLWNSTKTQLLASTVTNASGNYTVIAPLPGNYRIRVLLPNSMDSFSPKNQAGGNDQLDSDINGSGVNFGFSDTFNLANNVISTTIHDAGIVVFRTPTPTRTPTPVNIGNFVWEDLDKDGRQDAGEPGISGVTVQLWNSAKTQLLDSAVTNASGIYTVVAPLPGNYRIRVLLPNATDTFTSKDQAGGDDQLDSDMNAAGLNFGFTDVFNIASNVISTTIHDAGIQRYYTPTPTRTPTPINIGNFVWRDSDQDGRQDPDEPGVAGVTVQLWNGIMSIMYGETVTNASGIYTLIAPLPGNYRIRVLLPAGATNFSPKDGTGDQQDSDINPGGLYAGFTDVISIADNVISTTVHDAGVIIPLSVSIPPIIDSIPLPSQTLAINLVPVLPSQTLAINIVPLLPTATLAPQENLNACARFRLTSPLDGLPNGVATFYWDPADTGGVTYQISIFDEARNLLATYSVQDTTSLSGDVSQRAIGGGYQVIVQVSALLNGRVICTDERLILRAAPELGEPPIIRDVNITVSTATPTPRRGQ